MSHFTSLTPKTGSACRFRHVQSRPDKSSPSLAPVVQARPRCSTSLQGYTHPMPGIFGSPVPPYMNSPTPAVETSVLHGFDLFSRTSNCYRILTEWWILRIFAAGLLCDQQLLYRLENPVFQQSRKRYTISRQLRLNRFGAARRIKLYCK